MKRAHGFTIIELLVTIVFLTLIGTLFFIQKNNLQIASRDEQRKIAINTIYYGLEESFHTKNGFYPSAIDEKTLTTVPSELFSDPFGVKLGNSASNYRYEPLNCTDGKCKGYSLRTTLENESDFVKSNRSN
ncbi:hypothetical protein D3C85_49580 [compost metagenome]|jgi:type II secretory pathway pseudopilin PulG